MDMQRIERQRVELVDYEAEYGPEADRVADRVGGLAGEGGGSAPTPNRCPPRGTAAQPRRREGDDVVLPAPLPLAGNRRCGAATAAGGGRAEGTAGGPSNPSTQPITPDQRRRALDAALALVLADEGEDDAPAKPGPEPLLDPALQATFCEHLAIHGNARLACRAVKVSPTTAYRVRRQDATFRRLWNAALVIARDQVEDVLADRAVNGWEEAVFYHGEEVAVRRRYDSRLLLAHLARLDRLAAQDDMAPVVDRFDDALEAMKAGEVPVLPEAAAAPATAPVAAGAGAAAGSVADEPVPLLEARLRWLEARHGRLSVAEETFHLQNTVPRVPGSALWPHGWRGPDVLDGLPGNAVGGVNGVPLGGYDAVGEGVGVSPAARS